MELIGIKCSCPLCGSEKVIIVRHVDYIDWMGGAHTQDAFPYVPAEEREMLISGICPDCYDRMFADSDE